MRASARLPGLEPRSNFLMSDNRQQSHSQAHTSSSGPPPLIVDAVIIEPDTPRAAIAPPQFSASLLPAGKLTLAILIAALLLGAVLRLYGLNWDQGAGYHPDERWITMVTESMSLPAGVGEFLDPQRSPLNPYYDRAAKQPRNFAYGTLPIYLTSMVAWTLGRFDETWMSYDRLPLIGRALSGILDVGAILLIYLLGRRLFGEMTGALGALFYALTVLSIQHAHFYTTDITLNFFILLTIFCATNILRAPVALNGFFTGAAAGMALASKFSAAPVVAVVPVVLALCWFGPARPRLAQLARVAAAAAAGFFLLHFLFQPYAYLDFPGLVDSINEQTAIIVTGEGNVPYTRQYIDTVPYLYFIEQILRWAMGWPLGLAGFAGWALLVWLAVRRRHAGAILLLTWMVPYFLITGRFHAKFLRYVLPLLPFLALAAALALDRLRVAFARRNGASQSVLRFLPGALTAAVALCALFWALAFFSIYTAPHPANQAAEWINNHAPAGAALLKEHWEESLARLNGKYKLPPQVPELPMYDPDNAAKLQVIKRLLQTGDYMIFYSNRLYGTVPRLAERYPMSRRYYELLFGGKLGYELVHFSAAHPHFAGVAFYEDTFSRPDLPVPAPLASYRPAPLTINGGFADESFTAYDHPLVMVFKKTRPRSDDELDAALRPFLQRQ